MAITTSDILIKYATTAGSAGNSQSQGNPNNSLGKYISTTQIPDATLNAIYDDVTGDENAASTIDYRCVFVHNNHGSLTLTDPKLWISSEVAGGTSIAIGIDTTAASAVGNSSAQALQIANETTAPSGVSFSSPTTKSGGLSLGNIPNGQVKAFWVRRTAANSAALNSDGVGFTVEGDTSQ